MPADRGGRGRRSANADLWSLRPLRPSSAAGDRRPVDPQPDRRLRPAAAPRERASSRRRRPTRGRCVRRVSLVMLGLPPTPAAMVDRGRANRLGRRSPSSGSPTAAFVDEVLESPRYGERWAQHWLDVIRWAETWGFETNSPRPNAWPYRDWVIRALNEDLPYDRFLFEQLAGDTVGDDAATGLLVAGPANLPGQIGKDEESIRQARQDELDESLRTVGSAFLGLTIGCARCHAHKFDPITQRGLLRLPGDLRRPPLRRPPPPRPRERPLAGAGRRGSPGARGGSATGSKRSGRRCGLRPPLDPDYQEERFDPIEARSVRITIRGHAPGRPAVARRAGGLDRGPATGRSR